jgi:hypothetical protein
MAVHPKYTGLVVEVLVMEAPSRNTEMRKARILTPCPSTPRLKLASTSKFVTLFQRRSSRDTASRPQSDLMALICANGSPIALLTAKVLPSSWRLALHESEARTWDSDFALLLWLLVRVVWID